MKKNVLITLTNSFFSIFRPSHCASVKGCVETLKILDKSKADLWGSSGRGDYPVHEAAQGGHCGQFSYLPKVRYTLNDDYDDSIHNLDR